MRQCNGCKRWYPVLAPGEADTEWCPGCIADSNYEWTGVLEERPPPLPDREVPLEMLRLAGNANRLRREMDRLRAEGAEWWGPMQGPIKTFAPGIGWTRNLHVQHGRRERYSALLRRTAVRCGLYALSALLCIGAVALVAHPPRASGWCGHPCSKTAR